MPIVSAIQEPWQEDSYSIGVQDQPETPSQKKCLGPGVVKHICNLSYSGGNNQEHHSSKPA
jgi:hypothetical protein